MASRDKFKNVGALSGKITWIREGYGLLTIGVFHETSLPPRWIEAPLAATLILSGPIIERSLMNRAVTPMSTGAVRVGRATRGKVSAAWFAFGYQDGLRYVLLPGESQLPREGPYTRGVARPCFHSGGQTGLRKCSQEKRWWPLGHHRRWYQGIGNVSWV